jgi:predicted NBD/HSP70 family sugar kinase
MTATVDAAAQDATSVTLAAIEVGGSGVQTTLFGADGVVLDVIEQPRRPAGAHLAIAVPGLVKDGKLVDSANLRWRDVDPVKALGLRGAADIVCNDAHAAALGEGRLRGVQDLLFLGLGTGVGGLLLRHGRVAAAELGHRGPFSARRCTCGKVGCLETVAAGWALPTILTEADLDVLAGHLARIVGDPQLASPLVVLGGGITRLHPSLVDHLAARSGRKVEGTAAPLSAKSAAPWGLLAALENLNR